MAGIDKAKADVIAEALAQTVGEHGGVEVTRGDSEFDRVRQMATQLLAGVDYEAYQKYRAMKYGDFEPTLDMRRDAYKFVFETLLEKLYTKSLA